MDKKIAYWLFLVSLFICIMVVFGGLVRLTYSGLSIVEWKVITGVLPPLSEAQWQEEFDKYRQTPQYEKVFPDMTLGEFKFIYYMEYTHRLLGRITGLLFVLPFIYFWFRKAIPPKDLPLFIGIGVLFAFQGLFGWWMVKSGLVDQPQVSHYRLTGHLVLALLLLALTFLTALRYLFRQRPMVYARLSPSAHKVVNWIPFFLLIQAALGGMVAGLKAGLVSDTFPKMLGSWIPSFIWSMKPLYKNFLENPFMLHFLHRWFGVALFLMISLVSIKFRRDGQPLGLLLSLRLLWGLTTVQVFLGIFTVLFKVPILLASLHQLVALGVFLSALFLAHIARQPTKYRENLAPAGG